MATAEDGSTPPFWPWTHAYVINLERRPDRLRSVREWSAQLGVSIERVAAVDGAAAEPWDGRGAYLFSQAGKFRADSDVASSLRVRVKEERREERDGRDSAESAPCRNKETAA